VADFLIHVLLPAGLILSLVALVHCLVTRRGVAWALVIVLLGPLGGLFYIAGYFNLLPFKPPKALQATPTSSRRCPRCQQSAPILHEYQDGRKAIQICGMCKSEMELRRADFTLGPPLQ
jgi:hypothetical protein